MCKTPAGGLTVKGSRGVEQELVGAMPHHGTISRVILHGGKMETFAKREIPVVSI